MFKLIKPYKEQYPLFTINKIRSILSEVGIFVTERFIKDGDFFTCRLELANDGLEEFHIGTNGKGTSLEYAYASAYAEFMERLQNNFLISHSFFFTKYYEKDCAFNRALKTENKKIDFQYCPDERLMNMTEIIDENFEILSRIFFMDNKAELKSLIINDLDIKKAICVPFYNQKENTTTYLPLDLLIQGTGSTGMCAGNSAEEALVQGISEILERYAAYEIYQKNIVPPTIPHDYFKEYSIYSSIKKLEEKGLELTIKDFSLGKGIPVVAVIVVDKLRRQYNVKIGSDPWPLTAVERCLTELHQSFNGIRLNKKNDYGANLGFENNGLDSAEAKHINLLNIFNSATGQWPDSIFSDEYSYEFKGLNFNYGKSNKSDLMYLIKLVGELGYQIYIRDVSYLGFNSYYVLIPGLSQDKKNISDYTIFHKINSLIYNVNKAAKLSEQELSSLVSVLEDKYILIKENFVNFEKVLLFNTDCDATDLTIDLFLSMANFKLGYIDKAYFYLNKYLEDKDVKDYLYFYACKDYFSLLRNKRSESEVYSYLTKIYNLELAEEIIDDLREPQNIFKAYDLNFYFDCLECDISKFNYYKVSSILKNIELKHKTRPIDQMNLSQIFYTV